jgi:hypothetical protein
MFGLLLLIAFLVFCFNTPLFFAVLVTPWFWWAFLPLLFALMAIDYWTLRRS